MDAAIYHPTRNSFFAVRNGYISEYSTSLVLLNGPTRFASSVYGRSCIVRDPVADRIWVGTNGDAAAGRLGDTGSVSNPAKSTAWLYRIVPSTLALEAFVDMTGLTFSAWAGSSLTSVRNFDSPCCIYDVLIANGRLFFCGEFLSGSAISVQDCVGFLNLPGATAGSLNNSMGSATMQLALDTVNSPNKLWVGQNDDNFLNDVMLGFNNDGTGGAVGLTTQPPNGAHCAVAFASNGFLYQVAMTNTAMVKINPSTHAIVSNPALAGATIGGMTSRIRFNSSDNLLYIPCPATNQMIIYNPSTDTVSSIVTTGMDSPHDVVFGGGVRVAIQQGPQGLMAF